MSLPTRITTEDIHTLCSYLATKPTGATMKEIRGVVDKKHLDPRKMAAMTEWNLIDEADGKYKVTSGGREYVKSESAKVQVLSGIIRRTPAYLGIIERVAHRKEDTLSATDVAAHWHDHFRDSVSEGEEELNRQAMAFFQVAGGAELGTLIIGRKGSPTRFSFNMETVNVFVSAQPARQSSEIIESPDANGEATDEEITGEVRETGADTTPSTAPSLGQGIFVAHGKSKKPLEQLKKILDQFRIPYKVAVEEPNLGRPISAKVRDTMKSCNCAILIFSADEEFKDRDGNVIWRPSENVVYELGATAFLYDNRIVIMREEGVTFPSNFRDIGYITFDKDQLDAKALDILKELIGFGIVKVST